MASQSNEPLPDGYRLNNYTIEKLLSSGGFSIVYLGRDDSGAPVAIKEYLPAALVIRVDGAEVKINSEENLSVFRVAIDHSQVSGQFLHYTLNVSCCRSLA